MATINKLSAVDSVSAGDQFVVFATDLGDARRAPASVVREFMQSDITLPNGLMDIATIYEMRAVTPVALAIGITYANIPNWSDSLVMPAGRTSIATMLVLGEFVMQRDCAGVMFWVALQGTWPTNRDLTLGILVGPDAAPYESSFQFLGAGRGGGAGVSAAFSGTVANLLNPGGIIKAGEKVRLVAKMNVADTLNLTRAAFVVQTLDGI